MAVYGNIAEFEEKNETFSDYTERCDAFIAANGIGTERTANFFLAIVGPVSYKLLKDLCSPNLPNTKSYLELKKILLEHYSPKPLIIAERYKFWTAAQGETESVSDFIVRLKHLSGKCDFKAFLAEALRDRLVSGLHPNRSRTRTQLLATPDLTFEKARIKCVADEMATIAAQEHLGGVTGNNSHAIYSQRNGSARAQYRGRSNRDSGSKTKSQSTASTFDPQQCKCCGGTSHRAEECRFRDVTCHQCGKKGHIQRVCRSASNTRKSNQQPTSTSTNFRNVNGTGSRRQDFNKSRRTSNHFVNNDDLGSNRPTENNLPQYMDSLHVNGHENENDFVGIYNVKSDQNDQCKNSTKPGLIPSASANESEITVRHAEVNVRSSANDSGSHNDDRRELQNERPSQASVNIQCMHGATASAINENSSRHNEGSRDSLGMVRPDVKAINNKPFMVVVSVGENYDTTDISMELDTGASRSTISEEIYQDKLSEYELTDSTTTLRGYSGTVIPVLGSIKVPVRYNKGPRQVMELFVVQGQRPSLMGRDMLSRIKLDWKQIFDAPVHNTGDIASATDRPLTEPSVSTIKPQGKNVPIPSKGSNHPQEFREILREKSHLFSTNGTGIKDFQASLKLKPEAKPVFQKSRSVPYSIVDKVEREYERLVDTDILYPVTYSNWASPTVCVPKADGSIRICGDYKRLNEQIEDDGYKLPNAQDLFAKLAHDGAQPKVYSVIDLAGAFNQLLLDDESAQLLVLNTHKGLMAPKRLCFGVKTAPVIFQATMDKILAGMNNVFCYIDDILIATDNREQHLKVLKALFERFETYNVRLNAQKCLFFSEEVKYLGHILSAEGIRPVQDKVEAIQKAPRPSNVTELKSFLGLVNYYGKFVSNLASNLHPLYQLLHHTAEWNWDKKCETAFTYAKEVLTSKNVLIHYDPNKPLVLSVDASPYGLGAVISHQLRDGSERPIAFASRTLSSAEKNYAQIDKEGLAIVFGLKKFHLYLYGRNFTLVTDHQPLTRIFGPKSGIPPLAAARMQRWALLLAGYQYQIVYRTSAQNANADLLSRLPLSGNIDVDPDENFLFHMAVNDLPITADRIAHETTKDHVLGKVYESTLSGWLNHCDDDAIQPYWNRRHELSLEDGCILWGRRVIVPTTLRSHMLEELHDCHPGMCRMKALARSFVWWPGMDQDIEDKVRSCATCTSTQNTPKKVPLHMWPWATEPFQRVHVDFAEINGQQFFLLVGQFFKMVRSVSYAKYYGICYH